MENIIANAPSAAQTALTSAFGDVASDITATVVAVLPIALGIIGLTMAIFFGVRFFTRLARRG